MTLSFLPFSLLLIKLLPLKKIESENTASSLRLTHQQVVPLLVGFLMIFSVVGACTFQDPGTEKNGRVLIDEYHSQWEDTQRPLDTEWYGLLSTYNYYSWAQWLTTYYDVARNTDRTLTPELLRNYDILILKCPTQSYSPEEIRSIGDFVRDGGGLYLIGDHTNVFGMNSFLNQVSEQFGFRFNTDATYELGTGNLSTYNPDPLVAHAVLRHVHQFEFMTSCTIEPTSLLSSATMENIIIGDRVTSEPGTYATENFFRESVGSPDSSFGYLLQAAAMKYGQGRVVGFTDSTVFSSFSVFTDGYPAFTLGAMTYLNRTNTYAWVNLLCIALAVISAVVLIVLLRSTKKLTTLWVLLFSGALAASGALPFFSTLTNTSYPLPAEQTMPFTVSFEQQHSSIEIIVKPTGFLGSTDNKYGTFYVWTQRVGCVPSIENTLTDAITHGNVIVFINPTQTFTDDDIQMVTGYLEHGGRVLLMDSITNQKSTANELLGSYGVWISPTTTTHTIYEANSTSDVNASVGALVTPYFSISGGTQLLLDSQNTTMASIVEVSNQTTGELGKLVVLVDSYSFCDTVMGNTFTEPTDQQHRLYDTEFFLFSQVLKL
jgi:energy-converting hydrogenase Eha subunit B